MKINFADPAVRADPYPTYAYLREHRPVHGARVPLVGRVWYLSRYDDCVAALRDPRLANDRFTVGDGKGRPKWLPRSFRPFIHNMITTDGADHRRLRALVQVAFTPRRVESMRERVESLVEERLDVLEANAARGRADLIEDFALPVPLAIISDMMGVSEADRLGFSRLTSRFMELSSRGPIGLFMGARNTLKLIRFLKHQVADKQARPGSDLVSGLLEAESDGQRLTVDEVASMIFLLLLAGHETTVNLLGNGVLALLDHPEQMAMLQEDPARVDLAVEELLRFANPVEQVSPRHACESYELHGTSIRRGDVVIPLIASANRDSSAFERADELDITRSPNRHVAFGLGVHYCVGASLARMEGRIAINALLRRFPKLRLAQPRDRLVWRLSTQVRGLRHLPLLLD